MVSHGKPIHLLNTTSPQATPLDMLKLTVTIGFSENEPELQRLLQLVARLVMEQNAKANATGNHPIEERMGSTAASFVDGTEASESNGTVDEQSTVQLAEVSSRHQRDLTGSAEPTSGLATAVNGGQSVEGTCWMSQQHIENVIGTAWSLKHAADDMFKTYVSNMFVRAFLHNGTVHIDGLVQDCSIFIANALEILQSCIKTIDI